jgi:hypothetical protein
MKGPRVREWLSHNDSDPTHLLGRKATNASAPPRHSRSYSEVTDLLMARRENRYQSRPSQRYLYLIANAHRIAYRPGGQGHVLDLFAPPRFSVPAGAGPCFHHRHQLVFSWVLVLHLVDRERANLKALARHGPAHLAYQHYRCLLRAEISEGRDIHAR